MKTAQLVPQVVTEREAKAITEIAHGIDRKHEQLMGDHQRLIHHLRRFMMYTGTGPEPTFPVFEDPLPPASEKELNSTEAVELFLAEQCMPPYASTADLVDMPHFVDAAGVAWIANIHIKWEKDETIETGR